MTTQVPVHVMLVSEQAAANLLPALDPVLKPVKAVLLVSQKMSARADALESVLHESKIKTQRIALTDEHNPRALEDVILDAAGNLDGQSIAVNLTGGNKLMALAAQAVAQTAGWATFYVDVDTDQVIWLNDVRPPHSLTQQLRLPHYLRGYGYRLKDGIERPQPNAGWKLLLNDLIQNVGSFAEPIGQLNYLSQLAQGTLRACLTPRQSDSLSLDALLRKFEEKQILKRKDDQVIFLSEEARRFANGGWIEHHVYQTVCNVTGQLAIRDKAANLEVIDPSGQPNELDVAFLARNRLFLIECKTAKMDSSEDSKANDTLYKLSENCRRIGGLGTRGMLATYRPLRESELRLARALNIEVVANRELARLDERLKQWVNPRT